MTTISLPSVWSVQNPVRGAPSIARIPSAGETARFLSVGLLIAAATVGGAIAINDGRLHYLGLQWLTVGLASILAALILCRSAGARGIGAGLVSGIAACVVAFQLAFLALCGTQMSDRSNLPVEALHAGTAVMACGGAIVVFTRRSALGLAIAIGAFAALGFASIYTAPHVKIDVLMFQNESAAALLRGTHPYEVRYRDVYFPHGTHDFYGPGASQNGWLTYSFPYPPASLLLVLPGSMLGGDARWAHLAAMIGAGVVLASAGRNRLSVLVTLVLLSSPRTLLVLTMGWTEPLLILLAAGCVYAGLRRPGAMWLTLGLWLAVKQYMVLVIPLLRLIGPTLGSRRAWRQCVLGAALLVGAISVPFFATAPAAFVDAVVKWQFIQPFRYDALSFPAMRAQLGPGEIGSAIIPLSAAIVTMLLAWWKAPRDIGGLMTAAAAVFAVFFAFSKQAFCNYYMLVIGLCCCAVVGLSTVRSGDEPQNAV